MAELKFFDKIRHVDDVLRENKNILEAIESLENILSEVSVRKYFYQKLENVDFAKPLFEKGYFSTPPKSEKDDDKGTISFPIWPESQYLARMAPLNPELILEIILNIPETDNVRVYEDFADAALSMPIEISVKLAEKAKLWIRSSFQIYLSKKLGDFMGRLAQAGMIDESLNLAKALLEIIPDQRRTDAFKEGKFSLHPEATSRIGEWDYETIIKKNIPDLVKANAIGAFELFCDLLERAIELSQTPGKGITSEDYSYIYRPAIEEHSQNRYGGIKDKIINLIRDTAEKIIKNDEIQLRYIVTRLEGRSWKIFKRIAIYLIYKFNKNATELITLYLTKKELFNDSGFQYEYSTLLNSCFKKLSKQDQNIILKWIEEGPSLDILKKNEEIQRYKKYWQVKRLAWFKSSLPAEWLERYNNIVEEVGEPEHPQFASYSTSWVGPTSIKDADEIKKMSVKEIIEFLKSWEPSGDHMTPSPEGVNRVLSAVISEDPERFSVDANKFIGLHPTYIRALISGLRDALKKDIAIKWELVLNLCEWVLEQPREFGGKYKEYTNGDPNWSWVRKKIPDLFSVGFDSTSQSKMYEFRERIWQLIEKITYDPEPTPEDESQYYGKNFDPANLSINTVRGEAMHAVVHYALWIRRSIDNEPDREIKILNGLNEMPEVRTVLEKHLDYSIDPSLAIRSVYGQWFPWLVLLDKKWAIKHVEKIFPFDKASQSYWDAAWNTYIKYCQAYDGVFKLIRRQYILAVDNLLDINDFKDDIDRPHERLADHLMFFYWRGVIDLEDTDLFVKFWENAPSDIKGKAIEYIGRSLKNTEGAVPSDVIDRLKQLWNWRLDIIKSSKDTMDHYPELKAFGWWFASGKFEDLWAINKLLESVGHINKTDPAHLVLERLADLSNQMPTETVKCIDFLCKGDKEGWKIHGWKKHIIIILTNALQTKTNARRLAEDLIHYLGSRGWLEFGDLLKDIG